MKLSKTFYSILADALDRVVPFILDACSTGSKSKSRNKHMEELHTSIIKNLNVKFAKQSSQ